MTELSKIRKQLMKQRGKEFAKHTRKPVPLPSIDQLPSLWKKTRLMQLIELRYNQPLEKLIFTGTIYDVEKRLGVEASTVSKWRTLINKARNKEFFDQFKDEK